MLLSAQQQSSNHVSFKVVLVVLLIAAVIYGFGYARAVMHRANKDCKTVKAAVKPARKAFWKAWLAALNVGAGVVIAIILLGIWVYNDVRSGGGQPAPASSVAPSPSTRP